MNVSRVEARNTSVHFILFVLLFATFPSHPLKKHTNRLFLCYLYDVKEKSTAKSLHVKLSYHLSNEVCACCSALKLVWRAASC